MEVSFLDHHLWSIFLKNNLLILHKYCLMAPQQKIDASSSFSFSSCLLFFSDCYYSDCCDEWECSLFFCSDFREEICVDLNWKRFLAAARFEPSNLRSNTWKIRPQYHNVLLWSSIFINYFISFCISVNIFLDCEYQSFKLGFSTTHSC